ncbi:MAG: ribonuclease HII [Bacteroidetes bacterium]|nr:ribonuclease HII [Bacteroidota bacterium]
MLLPFYNSNLLEAGCDEAGRGCLAGPVFAAAVILPKDFFHPQLNDSKQLTQAQRNVVRKEIEKKAVAWAISYVGNNEIDRINILNASIKAMQKAVKKLKIRPQLLLVDGNRFKPMKNVQHTCIVKGDGKYASIAAASIMAKTSRDEYMEKLHKRFPHYCWSENKGYPTLYHRESIRKFGVSVYHRRSFAISLRQHKINFVH